jgi:hypothetical protein
MTMHAFQTTLREGANRSAPFNELSALPVETILQNHAQWDPWSPIRES